MQDKLGISKKRFEKLTGNKKKAFPLSITANKYYKASLYLFIIGLLILILWWM